MQRLKPQETRLTTGVGNPMACGGLSSVKRRSHKMAAAFRTEGSCLLLFYAVIRSLHFNKLTMPAPSTKQPDTEILHNS